MVVAESLIGHFYDFGMRSLNGNERKKLYRNRGMDARGALRFDEIAYQAGADRIEDGRAVAALDVDGDGDLDLVLQSFLKPAVLLVNKLREEGKPGETRWLALRLVGTRSNRDAIGARVEIQAGGRTQVREVSTTSGYLAGQSPRLHFGLGSAERVERVVVRWPSGRRTELAGVAPDQLLELVEPLS